MKKILSLTGLFIILLSFSLSGQTRQKNVGTLFSNLRAEQVKVLNTKKISKTQVEKINKAMKTSGDKLISSMNSRSGTTYQQLLATLKSEFKSLNAKVAEIIPGGNTNIFDARPGHGVSSIVKFVGAAGQSAGMTTKISSHIKQNLITSIRGNMVNGFGGQDMGAYFKIK